MIEVSAGVVYDSLGQVLICRRKGAGARHEWGNLDGLWEFPGGKREAGETFEACLCRELLEELDLPVEVERRLGEVDHTDGERNIHLVFIRARALKRDLSLHVHGKAAWVDPSRLNRYAFCPADAAFLKRFPLNE